MEICGKVVMRAFFGVLAAVALVGLAMYVGKQTLNEADPAVEPDAFLVSEVGTAFIGLSALGLQHILENSADEKAAIDCQIDAAWSKLDGDLKKYETAGCDGRSCVGDDKEAAMFGQVKKRLNEFKIVQMRYLGLSRANKRGEAAAIARKQASPLAAGAMAAIEAESKYSADRRRASAAREANNKRWLLAGALVLAAAAFIMWVAARMPMGKGHGRQAVAVGGTSVTSDLLLGDHRDRMSSLRHTHVRLTGVVAETRRLLVSDRRDRAKADATGKGEDEYAKELLACLDQLSEGADEAIRDITRVAQLLMLVQGATRVDGGVPGKAA